MTPPPARRRPSPGMPARRRGAFTLIELLVVVSIIGILLSLTVAATLSFVTDARESATEATLGKVGGMLERRLSALRRSVEVSSGDSSRVGQSGGTVLDLKVKQLESMPSYLAVRGSDYTDPSRPPFLLERVDVYGRAGDPRGLAFTGVMDGANGAKTFGAFAEDPTASSEALLLFLTKGESYGVGATDEEALRESELADTDGDGLREIVDGFGNPVRFYRWPTRLLRPAPDADGSGVVEPGEAATQDDDGRHPVVGRANPDLLPAALAVLGSAFPPDTPFGGGPEFDYGDRLDPDTGVDEPFLPTLGVLARTDPGDARGQAGTQFANRFGGGGQAFEQLFHTPTTYFAPLVVSAGADGVLGLYEPQDRGNFGHLAQPRDTAACLDNLTNLGGGI